MMMVMRFIERKKQIKSGNTIILDLMGAQWNMMSTKLTKDHLGLIT